MSEKCPIIAIDPGNRQSAYCVIDCNTLRPLEFGKVDNEELRNKLVFANEQGWQWAVIEMVASYGMPSKINLLNCWPRSSWEWSRIPTKIFWESCTCSVSWATMLPGNFLPPTMFAGAWWKSPREAIRRQRMPDFSQFRTRPAVRAHC